MYYLIYVYQHKFFVPSEIFFYLYLFFLSGVDKDQYTQDETPETQDAEARQETGAHFVEEDPLVEDSTQASIGSFISLADPTQLTQLASHSIHDLSAGNLLWFSHPIFHLFLALNFLFYIFKYFSIGVVYPVLEVAASIKSIDLHTTLVDNVLTPDFGSPQVAGIDLAETIPKLSLHKRKGEDTTIISSASTSTKI